MDSNWFKELFVDEAKAALEAHSNSGGSCDSDAPKDAITLVDQSTGKNYQLSVIDSELVKTEAT